MSFKQYQGIQWLITILMESHLQQPANNILKVPTFLFNVLFNSVDVHTLVNVSCVDPFS